LEKSFYDKSYLTLTGSVYESKFEVDNQEYSTRFNGNYTFSFLYGKEWTKTSKNRTIGLNARALYLGGLRERIVDPEASQMVGFTVYQSVFYENRLPDYLRIDIRLSFRKNKPGYTRTFALDIQNFTNQQNEGYHYYDQTQQKIVTKYQLGIIPVLVYRIDF
jgi:hypothetical protein